MLFALAAPKGRDSPVTAEETTFLDDRPSPPARNEDNVIRDSSTNRPSRNTGVDRRYRESFDRHDSFGGDTRKELEEASITSKRMMLAAGGFLDIALFTTNCEQLKFTIDSQDLSPKGRSDFVISMLGVSLSLQVVMALLFVAVGFLSNAGTSREKLRFINNVILLLVALVTLVNIVISTFSNKGEITKFCMKMRNDADIYEEEVGNYTGEVIDDWRYSTTQFSGLPSR